MSPLATHQIATARLLLRPIADGDAASLFAMMSDHETMRYWSSPPWTSIDQANEFVGKAQIQQPVKTDWLFGIEVRSTGEFAGTCTLFDIVAESRRAEIGYLLDRRRWGQGIMREAATALLSFGFAELGLHRVEADADPRNLNSVRLLERLGFVREGLLRERWIVSGEISDSVIYGLLAPDWAKA